MRIRTILQLKLQQMRHVHFDIQMYILKMLKFISQLFGRVTS